MQVDKGYGNKGLCLLQEMMGIIWEFVTSPRSDSLALEAEAMDICRELHRHLSAEAAKLGNETVCNYRDRDGKTVKQRLATQAQQVEEVTSGKKSSLLVLERIRADISHSDGMKQLLVGGGPFANEICDLAKLAGFALKILSGEAYGKQVQYDDDALPFIKHINQALAQHKLELG